MLGIVLIFSELYSPPQENVTRLIRSCCRLDKDFVVFQGSEQEALAVYLSGILTLRLKETTTIKYIRLHLRGVRQVS
jgi:hypothetical protein